MTRHLRRHRHKHKIHKAGLIKTSEGWKARKKGHVFKGPEGKKKAIKQLVAIVANEGRRKGYKHPLSKKAFKRFAHKTI